MRHDSRVDPPNEPGSSPPLPLLDQQAVERARSLTERAQAVNPSGPATGICWLQHGFGRRPHHLRQLAQATASRGIRVFLPLLPSNPWRVGTVATAGRQDSARLLATSWPLEGDLRPDRGSGIVLRPRADDLTPVVVAGHSAGGALVTAIAAEWLLRPTQLATAGRRLAGVILLDPVPGGNGFSWLRDVEQVAAGHIPITAIVGDPHAANRQGLAERLLADVAAESGHINLMHIAGGRHHDAEGASTTPLAHLACGGTNSRGPEVVRLAADAIAAAAQGTSIP